MFLPVKIETKEYRFVIDAGSAVTIISSSAFNEILTYIDLDLCPTDPGFRIVGADTKPINLEGHAAVNFRLQNSKFSWDMHVADIREDGIIGLDFLIEHNYTLGAKTGLRLNRKRYPCVLEKTLYNSNVVCLDTINVPPNCEIVISGKAETLPLSSTSDFGKVYKLENGTQNVLIANTLVSLKNETLPVRIMNSSNGEILIKKGTVLGKVEEVINILPLSDEEVDSDKICSQNCLRVNNLRAKKQMPEHLKELFDKSAGKLTVEQASMLRDLLTENSDLFANSPSDLGKTNVVEHTIDTGTAKPIKQAARRPPKTLAGKEDEIIQEQLKAGVIRESTSPWASPMVYVMKKDGTIRPCVDYRKLNENTLKDAYPLPQIDDCLDSFENAKYYSTLDLQSGYWQIAMAEKDKPKTAFVTRSGLYEYNTMPFGLCKAPSTFQRCMELIFRSMQWKIVLIYLDDIIIFSETFETHLERINMVFKRLRSAGFKLKASKCELFRPEVSFLGHTISRFGIRPSPDKVQAVKNWKQPQTVTQVRSFLGFSSYYRRYMQNFSVRAAPLNRLLEAGQAFIWTDDHENAFQDLKSALTGEEVMAFPQDNGLFILDTDASDYGIGSVLSQIQYSEVIGKDVERTISFASKSLTKIQRRYCVTRRELLAVVVFVQHFKQYLLGRKFIIRTDHSALRWIMSFKEPENQMARWLEILSQYDFCVVHRQGSKHGNADFLSRACEPASCNCYDGQTILSDLPCSGCTECAKKHEQWSSFMKDDNIVQMKLRRTILSKTESTKVDYYWQCYAVIKDCALQYAKWLFMAMFLLVMKLIRVKDISLNTFHVSSTSDRLLSMRNLQHNSEGYDLQDREQLSVRLPSYLTGYSKADLAKIQKNDPEMGIVIKWMTLNTERPSREHVSAESPFARHLWLLWDQLVSIDGILYKKWYPKLKGQCFFQLIAPRSLWKELLEATHNSKFSGHLGVKKVLSKLKLNFYWFQMKEYVRLWILKCTVCGARRGLKKKARAPLGRYIVGAPMDRVATDITGPFPVSEKGFKYILVIQDHFSKWVEAYPIKDQSAGTVAHVLVFEFFSRFGLPIELHSDQGSNFCSELFREVCKALDIHKTRTSPYHPSGNGMVEVFNKTLLNMISAYVNDNQKDWDIYLPLLTSAYRSCAHDSSGLSPNQIMLGREVHQPISLAFGFPGSDNCPASPVEYVSDLWNKMSEIQVYVRKHLGIAAERQKRDYDSRISSNTYSVGDLVYYLDSSRKIAFSPKLRSQPWKGPFVVSKKFSDLLFEITGQQKSKVRVVHHDRLKPYHSNLIPDWVPSVRKSILIEHSMTPISKVDASQQTDIIDQNLNAREAEQKIDSSEVLPLGENCTLTRPKRHRRAPKRYGYY